MSLRKRLSKLEQKAVSPEWPDVKISIWSEDARITDNPNPEPAELEMVVYSGRPGRLGQVFTRLDGEPEQEFLNRVER